MSTTAALVIVTLLQASPANYGKTFAAGKKAYDGFDLQGAATQFERAASQAKSPKDKAAALAWLGAVRAESADFDAARVQFRAALALDPTVTLSKNLSPAIHKLMEDERANAPAVAVAAPISAPVEPASDNTNTPLTSTVNPTTVAFTDETLPEKPRWALLSGGGFAAVGVLAVGAGAGVGVYAVTQRDSANNEQFQSTAISEYQKARQGAVWANVLYGVGGILVAAGSGLAAASFMGVDQ